MLINHECITLPSKDTFQSGTHLNGGKWLSKLPDFRMCKYVHT